MFIRLIPRLAVVAALILLPALAQAQNVPEQWKRAWPQTDFSRIEVNPREVFSGGPPKDGIPAINGPEMMAASAEDGPAPIRCAT
jgi:hypothetical protein